MITNGGVNGLVNEKYIPSDEDNPSTNDVSMKHWWAVANYHLATALWGHYENIVIGEGYGVHILEYLSLYICNQFRIHEYPVVWVLIVIMYTKSSVPNRISIVWVAAVNVLTNVLTFDIEMIK